MTTIVMAGLQGSGKTTTSAKIASFLKREQNKTPLLIGADLQRLAAQEQLKLLSEKVDVDVYLGKEKDPLSVVKKGLLHAKKNKHDVVIIDTAGRLHIDDLLMEELGFIIKEVKPNEILYVIDGMTGQDAVNSTKLFSEKFSLTGAILTKMDGNSGGGAALSVKEVSNCPIKFMTSGENINDIEIFDPKRISKRILGLSDIVGLVEKAQKSFDEDSAKELQKKIINNEFNFNDFSEQIKQFDKIGSITEIAKYMPGLKKVKDLDASKVQLKWTQAIIDSMTNKERENPSIINGSRRARIAKGSGRTIHEVNKLIKQFNQIKSLMKKTNKMSLGKFPFKF
jgi:signal recognition particle subunit SRP54